MIVKKLLAAVITIGAVLILIPGAMLFAQFTYDTTEMQQDLEDVTQIFSNLFGKNVGSIAMIGDPIGYAIIPHFEIGVAGGAVFVPIKNINEGTDMVYDLGGLTYTPLPSVSAHVKVNIRGFELGAKVAGIPPVELRSETYRGEIQSMVIGGKLRYGIIDKHKGVFQYGLSAGGFYEYTNGSLSVTMLDTFAVYEDVDDNGTDEYIADLTATGDFDSEWRGHTFGGEVQGNMKILFLNLFAGGRLSTSWGKATTSINADTSAELTPDGVASGVTIDNPTEPISVTTDAEPDGIAFYGFGGLEFKIFPLVLGARGGYNFRNQVITLDLGARLQF